MEPGRWLRRATDVACGHSQDTDIGAMFHPLQAPGEVKRGNRKGRWVVQHKNWEPGLVLGVAAAGR